jgi:hypothetical protein
MMLRIPTYLAESKISGAGLGVFCEEFVSAGSIIWTFRAGFDYIVDELPREKLLRNFVLKYGYLPITGEKGWSCAQTTRAFSTTAMIRLAWISARTPLRATTSPLAPS